MKLSDLLTHLANDEGCHPGIYKRGDKLWRAHINISGNYWEDDTTPLKALRGAEKLWRKAGKPLDGAAADAAGEKS